MARKDKIINKYLIIKKDLKNIDVDDSIFPSLNNYKLLYIIFRFRYFFSKGGENYYAGTIARLTKDKNISINDNDFCGRVPSLWTWGPCISVHPRLLVCKDKFDFSNPIMISAML